jgi:hypothetical protein
MTAKYKVGDHVNSWNSGLVYIVKAIHELDLTGTTFAYTVRRLRGGAEWGPHRIISECGLVAEDRNQTEPSFVYDPDKMFPFASRHRLTD